MKQTPLIFLGDDPTAGTGLGRILGDLASLAAQMPEFRVATIGVGARYSMGGNVKQYFASQNPDWCISGLPFMWHDFTEGESGILMTIWDASRLLWLARPEFCADAFVREFLKNVDMKKWAYFPVDSHGPHGKQCLAIRATVERFNRVLVTSKFGQQSYDFGGPIKPDILPHGISDTFQHQNRLEARHGFAMRVKASIGQDVKLENYPLIGIVATNQPRKDFGLAFQALHEVARQRKIRVWIHTDQLERAWSIPALMNDYGLMQSTIVSLSDLTDEEMAMAYSACDLTLAPGSEGWGYPVCESLACGTPVVHGNYAAGASYVPADMLVEPLTKRMEGPYNLFRPVYEPKDWAAIIERNLDNPKDYKVSDVVLPFRWKNLGPRFESWFREGIA